MKINISSQHGIQLIAVLKLNGLSAKEYIDFWQDKEKGEINIKNGVIIYNIYPHNKKFAKIIINDKLIGNFFVMDSFNKTNKRPSIPLKFPFDETIWDKIVESILNWGNPEMVFKMTSKW